MTSGSPYSDSLILGIESSCDDTSAAVIHGNKILANVTAGQEVHRHYGGVVPELASRAHQKHVVPVIDRALKLAEVKPEQLDAIAYTRGPGLLGSLLVGSSFAKAMAQALHLPAYPIHHMRAHILAHFILQEGVEPPQFPFLCLTVSGGHTQLVIVHGPNEMELIGETLDDAAGEAFDKAAKLLGLPYPGGPLIDRYAQGADASAFRLPRPKVDGYNWSFSGLKTAFRNLVEKERRANPHFVETQLPKLCASLQDAIVDMLMQRLVEAASAKKIDRIALAGGVSANSGLRRALEQEAQKRSWQTHVLPLEYCTDNGAMIAMAGYFAHQSGANTSLSDSAKARWLME